MLAAELVAVGLVLAVFVLAVFVAGAATSFVIARIENAPADWPPAWLLVRALAAGWLILAGWACVGLLLGVLTRGMSLAIGIGILHALVIEGLLGALTGSVDALEPVTELFLRASGYSLAVALGASQRVIASSGPGSYDGPFVGAAQAVLTLVVLAAAFVAWAAWQVRRRDIA